MHFSRYGCAGEYVADTGQTVRSNEQMMQSMKGATSKRICQSL